MPSFDYAQDKQSHVRNFCVIAHIDHGKSTLADRLLELTGTVAKRDMREQMLDSNPIERERGITIKLAPVRMVYHSQFTMTNDQQGMKSYKNQSSSLDIGNWSLDIANSAYTLNLIDTPGHVDFSYEVSRSLAACEGAILVVDATQGVQAQTIANLAAARKHGLVIIPVINKIDLSNARIEETARGLEVLGFPLITPISPISFTPRSVSEVGPILISAKTGQGVPELLEVIVARIPAPQGVPDKPLRALVFSSHYDSHKGVVVFVRVVDGEISFARHSLASSQESVLQFFASGAEVTPVEVGYFSPKMTPSDGLRCGEVGYIATGLKDIRLARVGDTLTVPFFPLSPQLPRLPQSRITPLAGYKDPKPMVFLGLFPVDSSEYQSARDAVEKLRLSDSAFSFRPVSSAALGNGFHCGFLGLLHAEIVQERLSREFSTPMLATTPSVEYRITCHVSRITKEKNELVIQSAAEFPDPSIIDQVREPVMQVTIYTPKSYVGAVMQLSQEKRGEYVDLTYTGDQATLTYLIPLAEMIVDFFDRLKAATSGYASLDYEFFDYQSVDVRKIDILLNHEKVDALSCLVVADQAQRRGREVVERLADVIPRQQFAIPTQAAIGGHIIARADVKAFRKDVTQKLYGGDRSRKDKLLDKQKKGKAKMKRVGSVDIPQSAFFALLKRS